MREPRPRARLGDLNFLVCCRCLYSSSAYPPLFRSAARHYGGRVIAILLTGGVGDGIAELLAVRNAGGIAIVQHPDDAFAPGSLSMPFQIAGLTMSCRSPACLPSWRA
jgi:chemotaxis response regulator CheB